MSRVTLISIGRPPNPASGLTRSLEGYLERCRKMQKVDHLVFNAEDAFRRHLAREAGARVTLLHSKGKSLTSEAFAETIRGERDSGVKNLIFAIGPADGWSRAMLAEPLYIQMSFGPMTLPHELALVVLAEQMYRALTILAGHPYHYGH